MGEEDERSGPSERMTDFGLILDLSGGRVLCPRPCPTPPSSSRRVPSSGGACGTRGGTALQGQKGHEHIHRQ